MDRQFGESMSAIQTWLSKRMLTYNLILFFVLWYTLQLLMLHLFGWDTAMWLFYFGHGAVWPRFTVGPGLILSPISHDMADITHLISNMVVLLFVGSFAEPYLERRTYISILVGVGFFGILFSNALALIFETQWSLAGASAGLLSLHAFIALRKREFAFTLDPIHSKAFVEKTMVIFGLLTIPILPIYELTVSGNIGHALGPILGAGAFFIEKFTRIP